MAVRQTIVLRRLLLGGWAVGGLIAAAQTPWDGRLVVGSTTYFLDLGTHPAWRPPAPPDRQQFIDLFGGDRFVPADRLTPQMAASGVVLVSPDWLGVSVHITLALWLPALLVGLLYAIPHPDRDPLLDVAAGMAVAGMLVAILYPCCWPVATVALPALAVGAVIGLARYGSATGRPPE